MINVFKLFIFHNLFHFLKDRDILFFKRRLVCGKLLLLID